MKFSNDEFFQKVIETSVRVAALALISYFCFLIFLPFLIPFLWGVIIAVGIYPLFKGLKGIFRGNRLFASSAIVAIFFLIMALPVFLLTKSFVHGATILAQDLQSHSISLPPPTESVKEWPFIGPTVYDYWNRFSENLSQAISQFGPSLKPMGIWVLKNLTKLGLEIVYLVFSVIIAGIFLFYEKEGQDFSRELAIRLTGESGSELIQISGSTIRKVTQGILGVAVIQSMLAGSGLLVAEVPVAGLWSFLVLILVIIQMPPLLILGPITIYLFSYSSNTVAIGFLIWSIFLSLIDTPLRALILGRGSKIPMPIIFVGAMGGLIQSGIIGLFIGAVVLALGYKFFLYWLKET